jgi:hypothetical protein
MNEATGWRHCPCCDVKNNTFGILVHFKTSSLVCGEELLALHPTVKLEDHPLSTVCDCLFIIVSGTLCILRRLPNLQPEDMPCCGDKTPTQEQLSLQIIMDKQM